MSAAEFRTGVRRDPSRRPTLPRTPLPSHQTACNQALLTLQRQAGNRALAGLLGGTHAVTLQRDAVAAGQIRDAVNKPDPQGKGVGFQEGFRILNSLPMYDMLSTLTSLQRSKHFDSLNSNFKWAIGVNTKRLFVAMEAVRQRGAVDAEAFIFRYRDELGPPLPVDQRRDIINYLDPAWIDSLKVTEDQDALILAIRATPAYQALVPQKAALAEEIITEARKTPATFMYHLTKLKLLFDTPVKVKDEIAKESAAASSSAVAKEEKRLAAPVEANTSLEEKAARDPKRKWIAVRGKFGGGVYYVDRTSPVNIVVRARIFLQPAGKGVKKDVDDILKVEDGIEKAASTRGYLVDLTFVQSPGADELGNPAFTVNVDPGAWQVATNWASARPKGIAHELHHMFQFELDRYNYIEVHATNQSMAVADRLYWFRQELKKPAGYNVPDSIMNNADHPNDDDVCRVAELDPASCVALRTKPKPKAKAKKH